MSINSERSKLIDAAIQQPSAKSEMGRQPIVIAGQKKMYEVFRLPTSLLAFNIRNGRFSAELRAKEKQLGYQLDSTKADDAAIIRDLLIQQDPAATELLKKDLAEVGQTDPGIITDDGFVINGNRRMAILQLMHADDGSGKFEYLEVHRLPPDVNVKDLWRIEAGLQLSRDKRLEYGPVNDLLKIREGLEAGLNYTEMAATLYGVKGPQEVEEKDQRLKLIDTYLKYIDDVDDYLRVNGLVEHFINLQAFMKWLDQQQVKKTEQYQWLLRAFELIRARVPHMEIRKLRSVYASEAARKHLLTAIKPKPGKLDVEAEEELADAIQDEFSVVKDYVELDEQSKKPELLLKKAVRALETLLKHKEDVAGDTALQAGVEAIEKMARELTEACLAGNNSGKRK